MGTATSPLAAHGTAALPLHVLVIDDDIDIRTIIDVTLQSLAGWHVTGAASGEEGIALARQHQPDIILLDVMMPGMDGMETARALASDPTTRRIPVAMLTARVGASFANVIVKPFSTDDLIARIRELVEHSQPRASTPADTAGGGGASSSTTQADERVAAVWSARQDAVRERIDRIAVAAQALRAGTLDARARERAWLEAHGIIGTAGVFGFQDAAHAARATEELLSRHDLAPGDADELDRLLTEVRARLELPG